MCIQETWLKPCLDFVIPGYFCLRKDKNSPGGGCATFISQDVQYRRVNMTVELECVVVEVWTTTGRLTVVNLYNPCLSLDVAELDQVMKQVQPPVVWTGDFNTHNPLWGSEKRDLNGSVLEDFMDRFNLVVMNDGRPTRFDIRSKSMSCIDLTFASAELARCGEWMYWVVILWAVTISLS